MKKSIIVTILFFPLFFYSCTKRQVNILILGNSITHHDPNASLDWNGNWGMAATKEENDFKSKFTEKLEEKYSQYDIKVNSKNIAVWENNFKFDLSQFSDILNQKYDILIVRLGENVNTESTNFQDYEKELSRLINRFKSEKTKVIITGTVWNSPEKDRIQEKVANDNNYFYIPLLDFQNQPKNYATGQFSNEQVAAHPSDFGMLTIAELLFKQVEIFLK